MFESFAKTTVCILFLAAGVSSQYMCTVSVEAENGRGCRNMSRSSASGGISVLLLENEQLVHDLGFHSTNNDNLCSLQLLSIRYSSSNRSGNIEVFLNNTSLGTVTTSAQSDWNVFQTVDLPTKVRMYDGQYAVRLSVVEADRNGFEIDKYLLQF